MNAKEITMRFGADCGLNFCYLTEGQNNLIKNIQQAIDEATADLRRQLSECRRKTLLEAAERLDNMLIDVGAAKLRLMAEEGE